VTAGIVELEEVLDLVLARPSRLATTRLVCVDGPAGSGKTTFSDRLAAAARSRGRTVEIVHMDDVFEGWGGLDDAGHRVLTQVVQPLARGEAAAYLRYDWDREQYADTVAVAPADLLIIEGVGSGDPGYAELVGVLVWVEAPAALRLERGRVRDGAALEGRWRAWMPEEERVHARDRTAQRADVLVDGTSGEISLGSPAGA
jgi:uridine kinase